MIPASAQPIEVSLAIDGSDSLFFMYRYFNGGSKLGVRKYSGGTWRIVGVEGFNSGNIETPSLAVSTGGTPYVIFRDATVGNKATVMKYDGSSWVAVGSAGLSSGEAGGPSIAIDGSGTPYISFTDGANGSKATVMKYNGASWVAVGTAGFTPGVASSIALKLDASGVPYVLYRDGANGNKATVKKYNGSTWATIGTAGFTSEALHSFLSNAITIDASGTPYAFVSDSSTAKGTVLKFDGSSWVTLGNSRFTREFGSFKSIFVDPVGNVHVGYFAYDRDEAVMVYNGEEWVTEGSTAIIGRLSGYPPGTMVMASDGSLYVGYSDMNYSSGGVGGSVRKLNASVATIVGPRTICVSATTTLKSTRAGGTWSSSNTSVATIGPSTGLLTAVSAGIVTITYTFGSFSSTTKIYVGAYAGTIDGPSSVGAGSFITLSHNGITDGTWSSSTTGIATAANNGKITGMATGTATISYSVTNSCGTGYATKAVTVSAATTPGTSWVVVGGTSVSTGSIATTDLGIDVNGNVYAAYDESSTVKVKKFDGTSWSGVGGDVSSSQYFSMVLDRAGTPHVACGYPSRCVKKYNGSSWQLVGPDNIGIFIMTGAKLAIDKYGTPSLFNGDGANGISGISADLHYIYQYNGNNWIGVGHQFTEATLGNNQSLAVDGKGKLYAFYNALGYRGLRAGKGHDQISHTFWAGAAAYNSVAVSPSDTAYMAYSDGTNSNKATVVKLVGDSLVVVGTAGFSAGAASYTSLAIDAAGTPYVAYKDAGNGDKATVMKFNGTSWVVVGTAGFSAGTIDYIKLAINGSGIPYVIFKDNGNSGKATVMTLGDVLPPITGSTVAFAGSTTTLTNATPGGTWSSSTPSVATVGSSSGIVTGVSSGTATISYIVGSSIVTTVVTICAVPTITSVSPMTAIPGATVTITGTNFNSTPSNNVVYFGATRATVTAASTTSLAVVMPASGTYAFVTADNLTCGRTASSKRQFLPSFDNSAFLPDSMRFDVAPSLIGGVSGGNPRVAIHDIDGDGKPDVVSLPENYSSEGVTVYRNISTSGTLNASSFAEGVSFPVTTGFVNPWKLFVSDIDGDGKADIMVVTDSVAVLRNTSVPGTINASSFASRVTFALQTGVTNLTIGDINGDGKVDIGEVTADSATMVLNTSAIGLINFGTPYSLGMGAVPDHMDIADIDGDGKFDLLYSAGNQLSIHKNYTAPIDTVLLLGPPYVITMSGDIFTSQIKHFTCGDLDGDNKPELVITKSYANEVVIYRNTATSGFINSGSFASPVSFATGAAPSNIAIGDINGDAKPDIAVIHNYDHHVGIFRNESTSGSITTSSFASLVDVDLSPEGAPSVTPQQLLIGDMDGDGPADLVLGGIDGIGFGILRNDPVELPEITGASNVCVAATTTLSSTVTGGTWSSSTTGVATVGSTNGVVSGIAVGTATISYNFQGIITTATITVNPLADAGTITGASTVVAGSTITLSNAVSGGTWNSGSSNATVSSVGVVTGVTAGTAMISYTITNSCGSAVATKVVTITSPVDSIGSSSAVCIGSTITLSNPTSGGTWTAGNTKATVGSASGIVTGVASGTVVISYNLSGVYITTTTVTVNPLPAAITGTLSACAGGTLALSSSTTGGTWSSSNTAAATVGATGSVTTISAGTTTISYTLSTGCAAKAIVTVNAAPASITGTTNVCVSSTTSLSTTSTGGTWSSSNPTIGNVAPTGVVTGMAAGTANITYTLPGGCKTWVNITVNALPTGILGTLKTCVGNNTTLSNATTGGAWSASNANATVGATGIVTGVSAGTLVISYTTAAGCYKTATVTINAVPAAITGTMSACVGATTTLASTTTGGTWSTGNAAIATINSTSGVATGVATGTTAITYTATGCSATAIISINALPPAITGATSVCVGSSASLSSGTGGTWSSSLTTVATIDAATGVATGVAAGVANITYSAGAGCNRTRTLTVNALPSSIGGTATVCVGATAVLTNTAGGGTWASSDTTIAKVGTTGVVTGMATGNANITYTIGTGCSTMREVTVNTSPAAISGTLSICAGATSVLSSATTGGTWSSSNMTKATIDSTGTVTGVVAGTATITYMAGCYTTAIVTVNALPTAISGTLSLCAGASSTLSSTPSGGTWSINDASKATIEATTGVVTGVANGTTLVTYTNLAGCRATATITVNNSPAAIGGTAIVCVGQTTSLTNATTGGTWSSSTPTIANVGTTGVVTGMATGTATITYSTGSTCRATLIVTVNAAPTAIGGTATVCVGLNTTLTNAISGGMWSSSNGNVAVNATTGVVTGVASGTSVVSYTTGSGCAATKVVTVNAAPAAITGTLALCPGNTSTLSSATGSPVSWTSSNTSVATINSSTRVVTAVAAGNTTITYTVGSGCYTTAVVTVNTSPATIGGASGVCLGSTITLTNAVSGGAWASSNATVASVDGTTGIVTGNVAGTATITYAAGSGCFKTKVITVNNNPAASGGYKIACVGLTTQLTNVSGGVWSSSDTFTAKTTVGGTNAVVTGVAPGTANITFTLSSTGCYNVSVVTVNAVPPAITGSSLVCVGLQTTLANTTPGGSWSSSNTGYANVGSATGIVTAAAIPGVATISYSFGANCRVTTVVTVRQVPAVISGPTTLCAGTTTTFSNSTGYGTWSSSNTSAATVVTGASSFYGAVTAVAPGVTTLTYTNAPSCTRTLNVTVGACRGVGPTSVDNVANNVSVSLYPNPTNGSFVVTAHTAGTMGVYSMEGKELNKYEIAQGETQITLPNTIAKGIYMCRFNGNDGSTVMVRLVVE
jgi:uncharacterized protein YjdB